MAISRKTIYIIVGALAALVLALTIGLFAGSGNDGGVGEPQITRQSE